MPNEALKAAMIAAITNDTLDSSNPAYPDDPGVKRKGMCSRLCRCGTRTLYKGKYQSLFGGSAIETGRNFRDAGFVGSKPEEGDFLIKMTGSGGFGHIGCYVGDVPGVGCDLVAENSSTKIGRVSGAKGYRTLAQFGAYQIIGRLPAIAVPTAAKTLFLNTTLVCQMPIIDGSSWCPAYRWGDVLGFQLDWDEDDSQVIFNGKQVNAPTKIIDGRAFVAIANLVAAAGLKIVTNTDDKVVVTR